MQTAPTGQEIEQRNAEAGAALVGIAQFWRAKVSEAVAAIGESRLQCLDQIAAKDAAYRERNQLVAALSKLFPSSLERHPEADLTWENDWRWIVFMDLPTGQASWHIHDSELPLFDHLERHVGREWDGHTTDEKYQRLAAIEGERFLAVPQWTPARLWAQ